MTKLTRAAPVFRFAPSPNGHLHIGHAYSARLNYERAQATGGRFLLRIEDIDRARCSQRLIDQMLFDLDWLGLDWETPLHQQSEHFQFYRGGLEQLAERGLLYPCFASRREIIEATGKQNRPAERDPQGGVRYPGLYKYLPWEQAAAMIKAGHPYNLRLHMDRAAALARTIAGQCPGWQEGDPATSDAPQWRSADPEPWGDIIVARKDTPTSYTLSVVMDDAVQGISHVVRGQDIELQTSLHVMLQHLLDLPTPHYWHHPLIRTGSGRKLSKSAGDISISTIRKAGISLTGKSAAEIADIARYVMRRQGL